MTRRLYHYAAMVRHENGDETWFDGLLNFENPIQTINDYQKAKEVIVSGSETTKASDLIVRSLTALESDVEAW
jgi:hypothetical protein